MAGSVRTSESGRISPWEVAEQKTSFFVMERDLHELVAEVCAGIAVELSGVFQKGFHQKVLAAFPFILDPWKGQVYFLPHIIPNESHQKANWKQWDPKSRRSPRELTEIYDEFT